MHLKYLKFLLTVGNILRITPNYQVSTGLYTNLFIYLMAILCTCATVARFYVEQVYISPDLYIVFDNIIMSLLLYDLYINGVYSSLFKKDKWLKLISFFEKTELVTKFKVRSFLYFFLSNLSIFVMRLHCDYYLIVRKEVSFDLLKFFFNYTRYCQYLYFLIIHSFLKLFLNRYITLKQDFKNKLFCVRNGLCKFSGQMVLRKEKLTLMELYENVITFNDIFKWIFFINLSTVLTMCLNIYLFSTIDKTVTTSYYLCKSLDQVFITVNCYTMRLT